MPFTALRRVCKVRLPDPETVTLKVRPRIGLLKLSGLPCDWRIRNGVLNTITYPVLFVNATFPISESITSAVADMVE